MIRYISLLCTFLYLANGEFFRYDDYLLDTASGTPIHYSVTTDGDFPVGNSNIRCSTFRRKMKCRADGNRQGIVLTGNEVRENGIRLNSMFEWFVRSVVWILKLPSNIVLCSLIESTYRYWKSSLLVLLASSSIPVPKVWSINIGLFWCLSLGLFFNA